MVARPTAPVFAANDSSLTKLQALSDSVAMAGVVQVGWNLEKASDQGPLTAGANTVITFGTVYFDPDGVSGSSGAVIVTPGYYDCEAQLPFSNTASANQTCIGFFRVTTGSNNPLGSGVTYQFGGGNDLTTGSGDEMSLIIFGTSPMLYAGDTVVVMLKVTGTGVTVSHTWNNSGNNDLGGFADGGATFTGALVSEGP